MGFDSCGAGVLRILVRMGAGQIHSHAHSDHRSVGSVVGHTPVLDLALVPFLASIH